MTSPIYIESLHLHNIRTFEDDTDVKFHLENGEIPQWTLILGDNGIGKSTLLQCIAWMKPYLPYKKDEIPDDFIPAPIINDEENEVLEDLIKKSSNEISTGKISANFISGRKLNKTKKGSIENNCNTSIEIKVKGEELLDVKTDLKTEENSIFYNGEEIFLIGYSASRQLGKLNIENKLLYDNIQSFIAEETILFDAEDILHTVNYAYLGEENQNKRKNYKTYLSSLKKMLTSIVPDVNPSDKIIIQPPKLSNKKNSSAKILFKNNLGDIVSFSNTSLGYRSTITWTLDLAWRLFKKYPNSKDPLKEPAIVLIDEIDLHLHPKWQRKIMASLSEQFPNVQFIATAHSPLMVQAALNSNYVVLQQNGNKVYLENNPVTIDGWKIDEILTSDFFGLKSSFGPKYDEILSRREELFKKEKLSKKESKELEEIDKELKKLPIGATPEEVENRKLISDLVEKIRKDNIIIEL